MTRNELLIENDPTARMLSDDELDAVSGGQVNVGARPTNLIEFEPIFVTSLQHAPALP